MIVAFNSIWYNIYTLLKITKVFRLEEVMVERLEKRAKRSGQSQTWVLRQALDAYLSAAKKNHNGAMRPRHSAKARK